MIYDYLYYCDLKELMNLFCIGFFDKFDVLLFVFFGIINFKGKYCKIVFNYFKFFFCVFICDVYFFQYVCYLFLVVNVFVVWFLNF